MPPGFLAVSSQPSALLTLEEFHGWYEEEHIPLRLERLKEFLSGARYHAVDGEVQSEAVKSATKADREGWLAMYEIDDTRTFGEEAYTGLRERRSERERGVMARLEVLVRRGGEVVGVWGEEEGDGKDGKRRTTGMKVGKPSGWVVTHGLSLGPTEADEESDKSVRIWAENVARKIADLGGVDGWVRVRVVRVLESGKTKMGSGIEMDEDEKMRYFVVHEFVDEESAMKMSEELTRVMDEFENEKGVKVGGWRVWKLYKAYPCLAQRNVEA